MFRIVASSSRGVCSLPCDLSVGFASHTPPSLHHFLLSLFSPCLSTHTDFSPVIPSASPIWCSRCLAVQPRRASLIADCCRDHYWTALPLKCVRTLSGLFAPNKIPKCLPETRLISVGIRLRRLQVTASLFAKRTQSTTNIHTVRELPGHRQPALDLLLRCTSCCI